MNQPELHFQPNADLLLTKSAATAAPEFAGHPAKVGFDGLGTVQRADSIDGISLGMLKGIDELATVGEGSSMPDQSTRRSSRASAAGGKSARRSSHTSKLAHVVSKPRGAEYDQDAMDLGVDDQQPPSADEGDAPVDSKERSREKNKVAAAKCRAKKRENMELIESNHRTLSAENTYLKRHEQQLRAKLAQLRTLALDHQHCNCGVHQYNIVQAGHLARELGDMHMQQSNMDCALSTTSPADMQSLPIGSDAGSHAAPASADGDISSLYPEVNQMDMSMEVEHDDLLNLQTPMDAFFYDCEGANEFTYD